MLESNYLLTDEQMAQFITRGYVVLRNDLPDKLHRSVMDKIHRVFHAEGNPGNNILPRIPEIGQFFDTPVVKGALTSVLGPDYCMHPHRHCHYNQPGNSAPGGGNWHKDGYWSAMRSHRPWWAMIFYYTQDITEELGPTAIMPGTQYYDKFIGDSGAALLPTGKAGTMVLVHFDIWHKASRNVSDLDRYMLKFQFVRLRAPECPSWNHTGNELLLPPNAPVQHRNLWQDVWDWLRGDQTPVERGNQASLVLDHGAGADDARLRRLGDGLKAEDASVRATAADELGLIGEAAAEFAASLGGLLDDPVEAAALNAAYALGHMGSEGTRELIGRLSTGTNLSALRAAYGLQAAGTGAVAGLLETLGHSDERRRALAAFALGMLGPSASAAVPTLIRTLQDKSEWVRRNAVEALGMIAQPADRVVPALAQALEDSVADESDDADAAQPGDGYDVYRQDYIINKIGYTAALALLRTGARGDSSTVVRALKQALDSKDRYVRAYACEGLTELRTNEAMDALLRFYRSARWCPDTNHASTF